MSQTGQPDRSRLRPFEDAPRPLVGYAHDYAEANDTGWHHHPRAQLLHAIAGVMRVIDAGGAVHRAARHRAVDAGAYAAHDAHAGRAAHARAVPARGRGARRARTRVTVVAVSPLLRELILAACEEPVMWDERGPVRHVAALALHEIGRAATRPISVPACRDPRLQRVTEALLADPADARGLEAFAEVAGASARTLARLFRRETGMSFQAWRRQLRLTEALALLAQGATPARAAAAVGYASGPAFGAAFRTAFGTTPGHARASVIVG